MPTTASQLFVDIGFLTHPIKRVFVHVFSRVALAAWGLQRALELRYDFIAMSLAMAGCASGAAMLYLYQPGSWNANTSPQEAIGVTGDEQEKDSGNTVLDNFKCVFDIVFTAAASGVQQVSEFVARFSAVGRPDWDAINEYIDHNIPGLHRIPGPLTANTIHQERVSKPVARSSTVAGVDWDAVDHNIFGIPRVPSFPTVNTIRHDVTSTPRDDGNSNKDNNKPSTFVPFKDPAPLPTPNTGLLSRLPIPALVQRELERVQDACRYVLDIILGEPRVRRELKDEVALQVYRRKWVEFDAIAIWYQYQEQSQRAKPLTDELEKANRRQSNNLHRTRVRCHHLEERCAFLGEENNLVAREIPPPDYSQAIREGAFDEWSAAVVSGAAAFAPPDRHARQVGEPPSYLSNLHQAYPFAADQAVELGQAVLS
ncbi:hypothetical protein DXG01_012972 [Tephrocybe rancida]|nr:hypothetical protein DXG01_012972 [Tephrocybe rancida]